MLFYSLYDQETASWTQSPAQTVNETDQNHSEKQIVQNLRQQPNPKEKDEANYENAFGDCVLRLEEEEENCQLFRSNIHFGQEIQ